MVKIGSFIVDDSSLLCVEHKGQATRVLQEIQESQGQLGCEVFV